MATSAGFKQQCPSCDAMVPIKDPRLIGKKTECPNCKYRFVVEEPDGDATLKEEPGVPAAKAKVDGATVKKSVGPTVKAKVGPQRRRDEQEAEAEKAKPKKKGGSSSVLLLGGGLAGLAILLLVVGLGYKFLFSGKGGGSGAKDKGDVNTPIVVADKEKDKGVEVKPAAPLVTDISNLLPGRTETVVHLNVGELLNSPLRHASMEAPGAFSRSTIQEKLGIELANLDRVVIAECTRDDWLLCVARFKKEFDREGLKARLGLAPAAEKVGELEYFTADVGDWLTNVSLLPDPELTAPAMPKRRPLAVYFHDRTTLVVGDVEPVKQLLENKGRPPDAKPPADDKPDKPKPTVGGIPPPPPPPPPGGTTTSVAPSRNYLTINPALKRLLDRMESGATTLVSSASDMSIPRLQNRYKELLPVVVLTVEDLDAFGWAIQRVHDPKDRKVENTALTFGVECKVQDQATFLPDTIRGKVREQALFGPVLGMQLAVGEDLFRPGGIPPPPPPPPIGQKPAEKAPAKPALTASVRTSQYLKTVVMRTELTPSHLGDAWLRQHLLPIMVDLRGLIDMADGRSRVHALAAALKRYTEKNGKFPRGTMERKIPTERVGRPWPPDQRVSWMAALLSEEYGLGAEFKAVFNNIRDQDSWKDSANLKMGAILVPAFLDARTLRHSWWVQPPSVPHMVATTQYVGVAGVGLDAADYQPKDRETAEGKMGVFGYDRETALTDIPAEKRGAVIAVLQVPPTFKRPWIAGGGATVTGVRESQSFQPFVSVDYKDPQGKEQRGTFAIMADCSVRFIPESIPNDLFKAMCTLKGGEPDQVGRLTTLVPSGQAELKAIPPAPKKKPAEIKKE